jgi:hypothetical protein
MDFFAEAAKRYDVYLLEGNVSILRVVPLEQLSRSEYIGGDVLMAAT